MSDDVTFWFDPACPFTWRTSRWLRGVVGARNLTIDWRLMSLSILNEDKEVPEQYRAKGAAAHRAARMLIAANEKFGADAVDRLYTEIGVRVHEQGRDIDTALLAEAADAAALPDDLVASADAADLDQTLRDSHEAGQARVGTESGSPILAIGDGPGFFGPVVVPVPEGEAAEKLFDAVRLLAAVPEFSELKRSRNPF
jgi:2-hydroxychromene-2-carboxylate isomerase